MRFLLLFVLAGCPKPYPIPPAPVAPTQFPRCVDVSAPPVVCDGLFTTDGQACAICPTASSCWNAVDGLFCVEETCLDPNCKYEVEGR